MLIKRRTFLKAAPSFFVTAALAEVPNPPTFLMTAGGVGEGATEMQSLAATMVPGQWSQLMGTTGWTDAVSDYDALGSGTRIKYGNTLPWNPITKSIDGVVGDHDASGADIMHHIRFNTITNAWEHLAGPLPFSLMRYAHAYDHNSLNPYNGDLYYWPWGSAYVTKKSLIDPAFSNAATLSMSAQTTHASEWWSGQFEGAGMHGCLVLFDGLTPSLRVYDPLSDRVIMSLDGSAAAPGYTSGEREPLLAYSTVKNVAVFGGGVNFSQKNKVYRLDSDGTVTRLTDPPAGYGIGIYEGLLVEEPATGNFLVSGNGQMMVLNPDGAGTWTQLGDIAPAAIGYQYFESGLMAAPIPDHGVTAWFKQVSVSPGVMYLYKHA